MSCPFTYLRRLLAPGGRRGYAHGWINTSLASYPTRCYPKIYIPCVSMFRHTVKVIYVENSKRYIIWNEGEDLYTYFLETVLLI